MAQVKKDLIEIIGLSVNAPLVVDGGADGSYAVAAHQIKWGESEFNGKTFGGTSYGLLTAIESAIENKTVDLSDYTTYSYVASATNAAITAHVANFGHITDEERTRLNEGYDAAYYASTTIDAFIHGENVTEAVDTLKDIQDYITKHGADASKMVENINKAYNRADNAYIYAGNVYSYASGVSSVAYSAYDKATSAYVDAGNAYTYASAVGAVADAAKAAAKDANDRALNVHTYASNVGNVADNAYARANEAYTYASKVSTSVDVLREDAYRYTNDKCDDAYTYSSYYIEKLNTRIDDIFKSGIDNDALEGVIGGYLEENGVATAITYTFESAASNQGKFISSVEIVPYGVNDFEFKYTYYSPKAEDYWEEYVPGN